MTPNRSRLAGRGCTGVVLAAVVVALLGAPSCLPRRSITSDDAGAVIDAGRSQQTDGGVLGDAGAAPAADAGIHPQPLLPDGGCPSPARLTPADLPLGFLTPRRVTLRRAIDGDTAHFDFPDGGPGAQPLRFLWVNTEESFGDATTPFGLRTTEIVSGYLRGAREIIVAPQEDRRRPGFPATDTFNRWLGVLFVDGELFQTRIVREGWSPYYTVFGCGREPIHSALLYAEAEARALRLGVWRPDHPVSYQDVLTDWIGSRGCRPNPYESDLCR